jgi:N-acetylglucosaminyldiphosphoundecaprenol N-acetyl-beta-D-mannosaminyltransferase
VLIQKTKRRFLCWWKISKHDPYLKSQKVEKSEISLNSDNRNRVNILGVGVSAIDMQKALDTIDAWIADHEREYICVANVHTVMESQRDSRLRDIHNQAGMVTPDGMPLVWVSHRKGFSDVRRVYGPDLMLVLCEHSIEQKYKHYFYGGAEGIPEKLVSNLKEKFPGLQVVGMHSPPFRDLTPTEQEQIIDKINAANPDIIWVGLGAPKQEYWMVNYRARLNAPVLIGVGAAFDFHSGVKKQAPLWMQRNGLEWLFRLVSEPRRLWKRYVVNNPLFVILVIMQALGVNHGVVE